MNGSAGDQGLFVSLRRLLVSAVEMAQVRLALLGTEVELEKRRVFDGLLWGAFALMLMGIGLVLLCGFIVLMFWEGYRLAAVGVLTGIFLVGGILMLQEARMRLRNPISMFDASVTELKQDQAGLGSSH